MIWWYWILLGVVLAAIELATPGGFYFMFFSVSALLVGVLELAGLLQADALQWACFSILSIASVVVFRKPLLERMNRRGPPDTVDTLLGEVATAAGPIPAGQHGRAELRGTTWAARNLGPNDLAAGERCRVVAVRGLELDIRAERAQEAAWKDL